METKRKLEEIERKRQEDEDRRAALDLQVSDATSNHLVLNSLNLFAFVLYCPGSNRKGGSRRHPFPSAAGTRASRS